MNKNNDSSRIEGFIIGAIFGASASAIASLLFAPKSGKDLRKEIGESTTKTLESTDEYLELAREKGTKVMQDMEEVGSSYFSIAEDKMKSAFTKAEDQLDEKTDEIDDVIEDTINEIEE